LSALTVIGALIGDILLVLVDPRIRFGKVQK
jgi:ABC-type dipeptide/oligopeptide/nickel transport system permease component